jgi:hypothetical protein
MTAPRVFLSYSHDSEEHKSWVLTLASDLIKNGIETTLDQWDLQPGQDMSLFMQQGISKSDRVIMVCSNNYVKKSENPSGGVGYERLIVTSEMMKSLDTRKFIPIVRNNGDKSSPTPNFIGPRLYINFNNDENYTTSFDQLIRDIHNSALPQKPTLGTNPFSGAAIQSSQPKSVSHATGRNPAGRSLLDDPWFEGEQKIALNGLAKLNIAASMELRFAPHDLIEKSQIELLDAVQNSNVKTFGWPIGIVLGNTDEYRPKPTNNGVRAEISIDELKGPLRKSYDLWAARGNGDFYLRQDLFEDQTNKDMIYFNTRIVRVAESIIFARSLYDKLGLPRDSHISFRINHSGIKGRKLSAIGQRFLIPTTPSIEDESQSEFTATISDLFDKAPALTKRICEPMFMLFDFTQFGDLIYENIVTRFESGEVS